MIDREEFLGSARKLTEAMLAADYDAIADEFKVIAEQLKTKPCVTCRSWAAQMYCMSHVLLGGKRGLFTLENPERDYDFMHVVFNHAYQLGRSHALDDGDESPEDMAEALGRTADDALMDFLSRGLGDDRHN